MPDPLAPQPPPKPGHGDVWLDVVDSIWRIDRSTGFRLAFLRPLAGQMQDRREQGIASYGTPLQYDSGLDYWREARDEALDLVAYLWAARAPWWMRWGAVGWAWLLSRRVTR